MSNFTLPQVLPKKYVCNKDSIIKQLILNRIKAGKRMDFTEKEITDFVKTL